jgi:probable HAF family extracellular repeat protein
MSPSGLVVGDAFVGNYDSQQGYYQPLLWQNHGYTPLPMPSGMSGAACSVSNNGDVAGGIWRGAIPDPYTPGTGGIWKAGQFQAFSPPAGYSASITGINAAGEVVGGVQSMTERLPTGGATGYAVQWNNGQAVKIGDFPNAWSNAEAINDRGDILLVAGDGTYMQTYVWSNSVLTPIQPITGNFISGSAINNAGQVVGGSRASDGEFHAFLWENGTTTDLGLAPGDITGGAVAINNPGTIVGYGYDPADNIHGLLWENGQLFELINLIKDNSGWGGLWPTGIADDGSIAGTGIYNGQTRAFLLTPTTAPLTPTPEPATAASLLLATTALLRRRRRTRFFI